MARVTLPVERLHLTITKEQVEKMKNHVREIWTKVTPLGEIGKDAKGEVLELLEILQEVENQ